jgi:hypothetical protein
LYKSFFFLTRTNLGAWQRTAETLVGFHPTASKLHSQLGGIHSLPIDAVYFVGYIFDDGRGN